jgi:hypothetical protein
MLLDDAWKEGYESLEKAEKADAISSKKDIMSFGLITS